MKHLIIIGARGLGRDCFDMAQESKGYMTEFDIKGFLDDKSDALDGMEGFPPILSSVENYAVEEDDVFVCCLGDIKWKHHYSDIILSKGGKFINLIHESAKIRTNTKLGTGCIIDRAVTIGTSCVIEDHCLIQGNVAIGHDVTVGSYTRMDNHVVLVGGVKVENDVYLHTSCVVNHNVTVGSGSTVGALSFVIKDVEPNCTVFGNPARKLPTMNV